MTQKSRLYDVIVIGGGPAGLTAGLYLARARYRVLVVEKERFGGQITITNEVVNYPGVGRTTGRALTQTMRQQAQDFGAEFLSAEATGLDVDGDIKTVHTSRGDLKTFGILIATGASPRKLGFEGEAEYAGRGVAYCATCDGMLYRGREIAVVGKTADAPQEANYLRELGCRVTYVGDQPPEGLRPDIPFVKATRLEVLGEKKVEALRAGSVTLPCEGVFILRPSMAPADLLPGLALEGGYIKTDRNMATNLPGVFAAGDCTGLPLQVSKAVGEGQVAGHRASEYVDTL